MAQSTPRLFVCAGLQCSGSTLVSWCFLQRPDMDGVLDAETDVLLRITPSEKPAIALQQTERRRIQLRIAPPFRRPLAWYKNTISSFRLSEMKNHYGDQGWRVTPLLVIRDVRDTWASIAKKSYGLNGTTAEDPPLRVRFRRFHDDWELFRSKGWPILRYESLLEKPQETLLTACRAMELPFDESMLNWNKPAEEIADARNGNESFWKTQGGTLAETLARYATRKRKEVSIGGGDLAWLESQFESFNAANDYPIHMPSCASLGEESSLPLCDFEELRRYEWQIQRKPIRWLLHSVAKARKAA